LLIGGLATITGFFGLTERNQHNESAPLLQRTLVQNNRNLVSDVTPSSSSTSSSTASPLLCHVILYDITLGKGDTSNFYLCTPIIDQVLAETNYRIQLPTEYANLVVQQGSQVMELQDAIIDADKTTIVSFSSCELASEQVVQALQQRHPHTAHHSRRHRDRDRHDRHLATAAKGSLTLLAILITDSQGKSPIYTPEDLYSLLFVGDGSVKSQYYACSFGQLSLEPTSLGVIRVPVDVSLVNDKDDPQILVNAAAVAALQYLPAGTAVLEDYADLTMFVTPSHADWVAYAAVGGTRSVFNDSFGGYLAAVMHEIG